MKISKVLTQGGGAGGFLKLIGGGGEGSGKISEILIGLAKSFFAMKMGKNKALQDWGSAGAESNQNDDNVGKWTDSLIGGKFSFYIFFTTPTPWLALLLVLGKSRVKQNSC